MHTDEQDIKTDFIIAKLIQTYQTLLHLICLTFQKDSVQTYHAIFSTH